MTIVLSCCGTDSNTVYILPPLAIGQSRTENTNVPYLDKTSDSGLSNMFVSVFHDIGMNFKSNKKKARLKYAACKVDGFPDVLAL